MSIKINYCAPLNILGLGIFSTIYYKYMNKLGYDVAWKVISLNRNKEEEQKICSWFGIDYAEVERDTSKKPHDNLPFFSVWHPHDILNHTDNIPVKLATIHFETDNFMTEELTAMNKINTVSCCSKWGVNILKDYISSNAYLAPGIYPSLECGELDKNQCASFYSAMESIKKSLKYKSIMLSSGKWEVRKQHFRMIDSEFTNNISSKILIIGLWFNPFTEGLKQPVQYLLQHDYKLVDMLHIGYNIRLQRYSNGSNVDIAICNYIADFKLMEALVSAVDTYISISAGEGWDQPLIEAMGLGKVCIVSNNTAHTEYANEHNCFIVNCGIQTAKDDIWFHGNRGKWYPPIEKSICNAFNMVLDFCENEKEMITNIHENAQFQIKRYHDKTIKDFDKMIRENYLEST